MCTRNIFLKIISDPVGNCHIFTPRERIRHQSPREPVAREGLKMIKIQSRCRGAARKSRRVLGGRVATRHPQILITSGGRGLICTASIGRAPGGHASTCSRGSCAGPAVCATPAPVWNSTFLGELSSKIISDSFLRSGLCWSCAWGSFFTSKVRMSGHAS